MRTWASVGLILLLGSGVASGNGGEPTAAEYQAEMQRLESRVRELEKTLIRERGARTELEEKLYDTRLDLLQSGTAQPAQSGSATDPCERADCMKQSRSPSPDGWSYSTDYLFALTRGVTGSTAPEETRPFWYLLTIPIDLALLPFSLLGGFAG